MILIGSALLVLVALSLFGIWKTAPRNIVDAADVRAFESVEHIPHFGAKLRPFGTRV